MLGAQLEVCTPCCLTDRGNVTGRLLVPSPPVRCWFPSQSSISRDFKTVLRCPGRKSLLISCKSSHGSSADGPQDNAHDDRDRDHDHDYLQASLLVSETISHFGLLTKGFHQEEMRRWQSSGKLLQGKESRPDMSLIAHNLLRRFQNPTIFLKVFCDGDFLLPVLVGEFAIQKLIDAVRGDDNGDCPDQYKLVRNVVKKLGYQVKMVRITQRVVSTYFARLYFSKPGENDILSVDARPSDAINIAIRCQAPIYVSKEIVFTDAIKIGYGMRRLLDTKAAYDVSLDSAADGPDSLVEELDIVKNMNLAVKEERYIDAAMWRDKLLALRNSRNKR